MEQDGGTMAASRLSASGGTRSWEPPRRASKAPRLGVRVSCDNAYSYLVTKYGYTETHDIVLNLRSLSLSP